MFTTLQTLDCLHSVSMQMLRRAHSYPNPALCSLCYPLHHDQALTHTDTHTLTDWLGVQRWDRTKSISELPADQRWVAASKASQRFTQATQPSSHQPQPLQGQKLLKMDPSQETGTLTLIEVGEVSGCSSIISGSWYSRELKYSLLYIIIRANFPFWNNVLLTN